VCENTTINENVFRSTSNQYAIFQLKGQSSWFVSSIGWVDSSRQTSACLYML